MYEAAASVLSYGKPDNLAAITDADDINDPADSVELSLIHISEPTRH